LSQRQDISLLHRVEQIFVTAASWKNLTTAICKERARKLPRDSRQCRLKPLPVKPFRPPLAVRDKSSQLRYRVLRAAGFV